MTDLAAWLLEQIAADEKVARRMFSSESLAAWKWRRWLRTQPDSVSLEMYLAEFDPVRVLDDLAAKRAIVELHDDDHECFELVDDLAYAHIKAGSMARGGVRLEGCQTLRLLATPYADHEGYREEWKP